LPGNDQTPSWRKSSFSGNGDCLEWLICADGVRLRDSNRDSSPELSLSFSEWAAFIAGVKSGEADTRSGNDK
jgi:hypothetical protein